MEEPNVNFSLISEEENVNCVLSFIRNDDGIYYDYFDTIISYFPDLEDIKEYDDEDYIINRVSESVRKTYRSNINKAEEYMEHYKEVWNIYNRRYSLLLSHYFEMDVTELLADIDVKIAFSPIFPRFLKTNTFILSPWLDDNGIIEYMAHEILHFVWFKKWKMIYPESKEEEFEHPHSVWRYSEMVVDPILNSKMFKGLFKINIKSYQEFYDKNKSLMETLREVFDSELHIANKIVKGYNYVISDYINNNYRKR